MDAKIELSFEQFAIFTCNELDIQKKLIQKLSRKVKFWTLATFYVGVAGWTVVMIVKDHSKRILELEKEIQAMKPVTVDKPKPESE